MGGVYAEPVNDHGALPRVLMVFDDAAVEARFLVIEGWKMGRTRVSCSPVGVAQRATGAGGVVGNGLAQARHAGAEAMPSGSCSSE